MIAQLKSMGFRTTLWVYPFINKDSNTFKNSSSYLLKFNNGSVLTCEWWHNTAGHVDFTNTAAQDWFVSRLMRLRNEIGIDSFKFDAGELAWIEPDFQFSDESIQQKPNYFVRAYQETFSRLGIFYESKRSI